MAWDPNSPVGGLIIALNPDEFVVNSNRRAFLKNSSLAVAAVAAGSAAASNALAQSAQIPRPTPPLGGTGSHQQRALWATFASAWVAFAKTGNPNNPKAPNWPAYDEAKRATMIFDNSTRVENDPRSEIRKFWDSRPAAAGPLG